MFHRLINLPAVSGHVRRIGFKSFFPGPNRPFPINKVLRQQDTPVQSVIFTSGIKGNGFIENWNRFTGSDSTVAEKAG